MDYVTLCNEVLVAINEVTLSTAGTDFSTARGVQTTVKNAINTAIRDIYAEETEWPFAYTEKNQALTPETAEYALPTSYKSIDWDSFFLRPIEELSNTDFTSNITSWSDISAGSGTSAYNATGNGVARLTGDGTDIGGITQAITTVAARQYRMLLRHTNNSVTVSVGTTSGGTEIKTATASLDNAGEGELYDMTFEASGATTYISLSTTSATYVDVDFIRVNENIDSLQLEYVTFDAWRQQYKWEDFKRAKDSKGKPRRVFANHNDEFGLSPAPKQANWQVDYDYFTVPSDMSAYNGSHSIPTRFEQAIIARATYYVLKLRSDPAFADRSNKEYKEIIRRMRTELINKPDYFRAATYVVNPRQRFRYP